MAQRTDPCERLLGDAVRAGVVPGAVWAAGDARTTLSAGAVGVLDPADPAGPARPDTLFDVASLTKVLAVWAVTGTLVDAGKLDPSAPLGSYWPEAAGRPLAGATAHHLLTHTAGLPLRANLRHLYGSDPQDVRDGVLSEPLRHRPGEAVAYTDRAALILGYLAEHLTGSPSPARRGAGLGAPRHDGDPVRAAAGRPPRAVRADGVRHGERRPAQGTVHDFSTRLLGGACGIAGVFTTAADTGRFLRHLLDPVPGTFSAAWTAASLRVRTGRLDPPRGFFWHPAPGTGPADDVWAHFGFTGTALWVSPARDRWAVLLTNRLYLTRDPGPLARVRDAFRALVFP